MRILLFILLSFLSFNTFAQSSQSDNNASKIIIQNKHFFKYNKSLPGSEKERNKGEVEIIYFFWYGSPWAAQVDKELRQWAKTRPYNLKFTSYPVSFDKKYGPFAARIFFALSYLNKEETLSPLFIEAVDKKQVDLKNPSSVLTWMANHGVNERDFQLAINHYKVKSSSLLVPKIMDLYEIQSVPSVVIDGQYQIRAYEDLGPSAWLDTVKFMSDKLAEGKYRP